MIVFRDDIEKGRKIAEFIQGDLLVYSSDVFRRAFESYDVIIALMSTGIVVRKICGLLRSKWSDPAVIAVDRRLKYAIPVSGGHHGGNEIALKLGELGIKPVITTSFEWKDGVIVGIGARRGVTEREVLDAIFRSLEMCGLSIKDVRGFATLSVKENEKGIIMAVDSLKLPLMIAEPDDIDGVMVKSGSAALKKIGVKGVAEPSALFFSKKRELILPKTVFGRVTVAIAR